MAGLASARWVLPILVVSLGASLCGCGATGSSTYSARAATSLNSATLTGSARTASPQFVASGTNRSLARAAAKRAFKHFPVPAGAARLHAAPRHAPFLRHLRVQDGEVDASLTRTGWWLVPRRYDRVVAWYVARTGANPASTYYPDQTDPAPEATLDWVTHDTSPAYSRPADILAYTRLGPHKTAIRTDVTLAARFDRTADTLVPTTLTSIEITRRAIDGPDTTPTTVEVTNQSLTATAATAFDELKGAYASTEPHGCGSPVGIQYAYAVTFNWPGHTLAVDPGAPLCDIGRGLTLDGTKLATTLQDDKNLNRVLNAAFGPA